jgi:hypothetical protein
MHKLTFALGAAAAASIAAAASSVPARALVLPAPTGLGADAQNIAPAQNIHYVCRYGYYGRVCSWRPPYYSYGYAPYNAYGYAPYRPYYRPYWRYGYRRHWW